MAINQRLMSSKINCSWIKYQYFEVTSLVLSVSRSALSISLCGWSFIFFGFQYSFSLFLFKFLLLIFSSSSSILSLSLSLTLFSHRSILPFGCKHSHCQAKSRGFITADVRPEMIHNLVLNKLHALEFPQNFHVNVGHDERDCEIYHLKRWQQEK